MDYFVSIENIPYHRWQVELLIESFKKHNLQDKLVVGVAENTTSQFNGFYKNLSAHSRKFAHENVGEKKGCKGLNKPLSILMAFTNGLLTQPFTVIHPDMVLYKPMNGLEFNNFVFHPESEDVDLKKRLGPYLGKILSTKGDEEVPWLGVDGVCAFNEVPMSFFHRVMHYVEKFQNMYVDWEDVPKAAWTCAFYEYFALSTMRGKILECDLRHHVDFTNACFIHYRHGALPNFHKKQFMFPEVALLSLHSLDPMDVLQSFDYTTSMQYVAEIVRQYKQVKSEPIPDNPPPTQYEVLDDIIEPRIG